MYRYRIGAFILCISVILFDLNVYGADPVSGLFQSVSDSISSVSDSLSNEVTRSGGLTEVFDTSSGFYIEKLDEGLEFLSSVPNGAVVSDAVYFDIPTGLMSAELEYEGVKTEFKNKTPIYGKGYYILRLSAFSGTEEPYVGVFTFRINDAPQNRTASSAYKYPVVKCSASISESENGMYRYMLPNYKAFFTNIPTYGETVDNAVFVIPRNMGYSLTKNGKTIGLINNHTYSEPGNYSLRIFASSYAAGGGYEAYYETILNFTVGAAVGNDYAGSLGSIVQDAAEGNFGSVGSSIGSSVSSVANSVIGSSGISSGISSGSGSSWASGLFSGLAGRTGANGSDDFINDYLNETYFENAKLYSETFSSGDSFYTNTPADGIVGGNVYIDIPYNMSVSMTKDGLSIPFENKTYINERGSYSLLVNNADGEDIKTARFNFRIQEGLDNSPDIVGAVSPDSHDSAVGAEEILPEAVMADESEVVYDPSVKYDVENNYSRDKEMYVFNAGSTEFFLSVPAGMISNYDVVTDVPADAEVSLEKDGTPIDYTSVVSGDGHYELSVTEAGGKEELTVSFDIVYYSTNAFDSFTAPEGYYIAASQYEDYYGIYTDPDDEDYLKGMETINSAKETPSNVFEMPLDGEYDFILRGTKGMPMISATIIADRMAPVVRINGEEQNLKTNAENVGIYCGDTEAVVSLIDSEGNESFISLNEGKGEISGKGEYIVRAEDMAGNVNEYELTLGYTGLISKIRFFFFIILSVLVVIVGAVIGVLLLLAKKGIIGKGKTDKARKVKEKKVREKKDKKSKDNKKEDTSGYDEAVSSSDDWESEDYFGSSGGGDIWETGGSDDWENDVPDNGDKSGSDDWKDGSSDDWINNSDDDDWENG